LKPANERYLDSRDASSRFIHRHRIALIFRTVVRHRVADKMLG